MAKLAKGTARSAKAKVSESKASPAVESHSAGKKSEKVKATTATAAAAKAVAAPTEGAKKVSQKLLETIEKRKKAKGMFGKPPGRRGRRPKNAAEYTPSNQEEDGYVLEQDMEGIEYDTGIRMKEGGDESGFALDRFDDFEVEELNFD